MRSCQPKKPKQQSGPRWNELRGIKLRGIELRGIESTPTQHAFRPMVDILSIYDVNWVVALNMAYGA